MNQNEAIDLYLGVLARRGRARTTLDGYRRLLNHLADLAPGRDTHELELADYDVHMQLDCFCTPPKRLTTNAEKQSDRCDNCGAEILAGQLATGPRMYLVKDDEA